MAWFGAVLFPNLYLWLIFVSALDVILTRVVLFFGGKEVNPIAKLILDEFGRIGMSIFKFIIVAFVVIVCEYIGRRNWKTARNLAVASILITIVPVLWSFIILMTPAPPAAPNDGRLFPEENAAGSRHIETVEPAVPMVDILQTSMKGSKGA